MQDSEQGSAYTVTQAMNAAKRGLEKIRLTVIGEVSEFNDKPGYKAAYFSVHDDGCSMPCIMWRDRYNASGVVLQAGMLVELTGNFSCYPAKGRLQFSVASMQSIWYQRTEKLFGSEAERETLLSYTKQAIDFAEAAGCPNLVFIVRILISLTKSAIGAMAVYTFINAYNMYMWPLLVTGTEEMRTVQIGISMLNSVDSQSITMVIAGVVMVILPSLFVFILGQKQLIRGMFSGAVKG